MSSHQSESDSEEALFLPQAKESIEVGESGSRRKRWSLCEKLFRPHNFIYIAILVNFVWSAANLRHTTSFRPSESPTIYEPFDIPIEYQSQSWNLPIGVKTPFTSFDVQEADEAWNSIEVSNDLGVLNLEPARFNAIHQASTIKFDDQSGYLFVGDVFHQLHCLNYLRKKTVLYNHLYPYEMNDPEVPAEFHLPHCIDSIRLSLQCHADLSLIPFRWADGWSEPWPDFSNKHMCRDFNKVREWALENQATLKASLSHPELGPVGETPLNLSALPIWQEEYDHNVKLGRMPVCYP